MESSIAGRSFVEADINTWTDADNRRLLEELDPIFLAPQGTPEAVRAANLVDLIEAYEEKRYRITEWLAAGNQPRVTSNVETKAFAVRLPSSKEEAVLGDD